MSTPDKTSFITRALSTTTSALGSPPAIIASAMLIVGWMATGPLAKFSDTWQLVINTTTTIITFLMVFVIQNTQNRDGRAIQTKLDAIIEALEHTDNDLVGLEELPEKEIKSRQEAVRESVAAVAETESGEASS